MDYELPLEEFYQQLQAYVDWTDTDAALIVQMAPWVTPTFDAMVEDFYEAIQRYPFTFRVITEGEPQISRLKGTLHAWLKSLFGGQYDLSFATSRWRVGRRHVEIGLHQAYAIAALDRLRLRIIQTLMESKELSPAIRSPALMAINKLLDIDAAIIEFAYQQANAERLHQVAMVRVQQAERLAAIGQMVTGLAHESRNALQRSHACLEALKLYIDDRPEAMVQAERIQKALDRLHVLYEEVRNYAAPIRLDCEPTDLHQVVKSAWGNLEPRWSPLGVSGQIIADVSVSCLVPVDRHRIDQVLTNLMQNAVDACGERGTVRCTIAANEGDGTCTISIEDTGPGVEPQLRSQVFEPFFTTKTKGTGLGLAITRRIVEAHGGSICVDHSDLGGARFILTIPCQARVSALEIETVHFQT
mgnify:CR=1 FL=1